MNGVNEIKETAHFQRFHLLPPRQTISNSQISEWQRRLSHIKRITRHSHSIHLSDLLLTLFLIKGNRMKFHIFPLSSESYPSLIHLTRLLTNKDFVECRGEPHQKSYQIGIMIKHTLVQISHF